MPKASSSQGSGSIESQQQGGGKLGTPEEGDLTAPDLPSAPPGAWRAQARKWLYTGASLAGLILLWEAAVRLLDIQSFLLPAPSAIVEEMIASADVLASNALVTLWEVLLGFGLGVSLGIVLAIGIVYSSVFERTVYPILVTFQTIPKIVLAPIFVLWFGFGIAPKVLVAMLICFFVMVVNTVVGMRNIEPAMLYLVRSFGASEWQTFVKIRLPAAMPNIFGGLKVSITQALVGAIVGEYIAAQSGLGVVQLRANEFLDITLQFAAVTTIALLGIGLFAIVTVAERVALPWRRFMEEQVGS